MHTHNITLKDKCEGEKISRKSTGDQLQEKNGKKKNQHNKIQSENISGKLVSMFPTKTLSNMSRMFYIKDQF